MILLATVTVVVWEGEEQDTKSEKSDNNSAKIPETNAGSKSINRFDCFFVHFTISFFAITISYVLFNIVAYKGRVVCLVTQVLLPD